MAFYRKRLSCQGFGEHSANLFLLDDRIFWTAKYGDTYSIFSKLEDYGNVDDPVYKLGARSHFLGFSDYGGFSIISYRHLWAAVYCVDGELKSSLFGNDFEARCDQAVLWREPGYWPLICYNFEKEHYLIAYMESRDDLLHGFITYDFLTVIPIELERMRTYWKDYLLPNGSCYTFEHYMLAADYLKDII